MKKINITLTFEDEKLEALEFSLRKENASVRSRLDEALRQLYESCVPEPVREYLDGKETVVTKSERPPRPRPPKVPAPVADKGGSPGQEPS